MRCLGRIAVGTAFAAFAASVAFTNAFTTPAARVSVSRARISGVAPAGEECSFQTDFVAAADGGGPRSNYNRRTSNYHRNFHCRLQALKSRSFDETTDLPSASSNIVVVVVDDEEEDEVLSSASPEDAVSYNENKLMLATSSSSTNNDSSSSSSLRQNMQTWFPVALFAILLPTAVAAKFALLLPHHHNDHTLLLSQSSSLITTTTTTMTTTLIQMATGIPKDLWHMYEQNLAAHPIQTKALTSATVYTVGDVIAQTVEQQDNIMYEKEEEHDDDDNNNNNNNKDTFSSLDLARTFRSMLAGLIGHGPMSHFYYNLSEDLFQNVLHMPAAAAAGWSGASVVLPKIALDQAFFGPLWNNTYILLLGLMKWESPATIWADMKRTTFPLVLDGLKLWPAVHCITYGLIPVDKRLLWVDTVEILWVTLLATRAAENNKHGNDGGGDGGGAEEHNEGEQTTGRRAAAVVLPMM